jgi:hypothetical protein
VSQKIDNFGQGDLKMRALTMDEVRFVSGGWLHHTPGESWGDSSPPWGSESLSNDSGGGGNKGGIFNAVKNFLGGVSDFLTGGCEIKWTSSKSDGSKGGVCLDGSGNVIKNNDGNPLLACSSVTGGVSFSWGN